MAILSVKENVEINLPGFLYEEFENEKYGRTYLEEIDRKLFLKY